MTKACAIHVGQVAVVKRLRSIVRADGRRLEVEGRLVVSRADPRGGTQAR